MSWTDGNQIQIPIMDLKIDHSFIIHDLNALVFYKLSAFSASVAFGRIITQLGIRCD
jgi:hypothetical protein